MTQSSLGDERVRGGLSVAFGLGLVLAATPARAQSETDHTSAPTVAAQPEQTEPAPTTTEPATAQTEPAPESGLMQLAAEREHHGAGSAVRAVPARLWRTGWRAVTTLEFGLTVGLGVTAVGVSFLTPGNPPRHFQGGWLFDDAFRDAFRANTPQGRSAARTASDLLLYAFIGAPYAQAAVSAWIARDEPRTAFQLSLIATETYAVTWAVMWGFKAFMGRERPYVTANRTLHGCDTNTPDDPSACVSTADDNASFLSGHSAFSFASAALLCSHGLYLGLGSTRWDVGLCAGAMMAAATTATLRVVADVHYATDILAGSVLGLLTGLVIPGLYHFHGTVVQEPPPVDRRADRSYAPRAFQVLPMMLPQGAGLAVAGLVL